MSCYFPNIPESGFEIYRDELDTGCSHETDGHGRGTEEFVYVISGTLAMITGGATHVLHTGDTIRFDASRPHIYTNEGSEVAVMLVMNRYPNQ